MDKDILTAVKEQCISGINEEGLKNTLEKFDLTLKGRNSEREKKSCCIIKNDRDAATFV